MKVADVMTRGVGLVSPDATAQQAAIQMAELDVGALLVGDDRLEGVLTDRDLILRVVVEGRDVRSLAVREVMSSMVFACHADDPIESAFREMRERQVRRLPVLDADERLVGIVTLGDVSRAEPGHAGEARLVEALRAIAEPHRQRARGPREPELPDGAGDETRASNPPPGSQPPGAPKRSGESADSTENASGR